MNLSAESEGPDKTAHLYILFDDFFSYFRKALKATFVLIPLFGLQQFLVIYRPPAAAAISFAYEIFQSVIKNTQVRFLFW